MRKFLFLLVVLAGCGQKDTRQEPVNEQEVRERMVNANRILVQKEAGEIKDFILRHGWKMKQTGSGLQYEIYREGRGDVPAAGAPLTAAFKVFRIDGTFCYEADSLHPVTFLPGKGQQPKGLEEGLLMMKEGGRARLVLPAHLGFGTAGDGNKIPGNAALYYDVIRMKDATH